MSKLIFPEHGGMYVDDDARVVKTIRHKDRDGTYTVKIVAFPTRSARATSATSGTT